jgi:hypothetical protein
MPSFLTPEQFRQRAAIPREYVDAIEQVEPGWLDLQLSMKTAWIIARLDKRYGPFVEPYPDALMDWLVAIVTPRVWLRRGHDPTDEQALEYKADAERATAEVMEAANSETGLFDLPLRANTTASGISKGGPFGYSEQSPYVSFDQQREVGRNEDFSGGGTYG